MAKNMAEKRLRGLTAFVLAIMLILELLPLSINAAEEQTEAPKAENCVVYKNRTQPAEEPDWDNPEVKKSTGFVPTLYMWNYGREATLRVYSAVSGGQLMGTGTYNQDSHYWVVPLEAEKEDLYGARNYSDYVYVTLQESGKAESERVAVVYPENAASIAFEVYTLRDQTVNKQEVISGASRGVRVGTPGRMTVGSYLYVDVVMKNFTKVQSITLPIKYDPEYLELTALAPATINGVQGYTIGSAVAAKGEGKMLPQFMVPNLQDAAAVIGGNPSYGIGVYRDLYNMEAIQDCTSGSTERQTPYVNTETGLIKLEFNNDSKAVDLSNLADRTTGSVSISSTRKTVRIFFKCKKAYLGSAAWGDQEAPLHFASTADVPVGVTDRNIVQRYCHLTSPSGYRVSVQAINLLTTPLPSKYLEPATYDIVFAAGEIKNEADMSASYDERIKQLVQNTVKVYNYSNSNGGAASDLDGVLTDVFILTPSKDAGAAKKNDKISIYKLENGSYIKIVDGYEVGANGDGEYGAIIDLGYDKLDPDGGSLYVSVIRTGEESAKIEVPYSPEMSRDIYFDLKSSGYTNEYAQNKFLEDYQVKAGDQLRLDIYFNNFSELLSYSFKIKFNKDVLKAADKNFDQLDDGPTDGSGVYISQSDYEQGITCVEPGVDLQNAPTFNESLAMAAYREYTQAKLTADEAMAIMQEQLPDKSITSTNDMDAVAGELAAKYPFGGDDGTWDGGLMFSQLTPYYNNYTGEMKFYSARLKYPPIVISKSDYGTHGYHFISVYFTAVASGEAGLTIEKGNDGQTYGSGVEKLTLSADSEIVLNGPGYARDFTADNVCSLPVMTHWSVANMTAVEKEPTLKLIKGNKDSTSDDIYLYEGYPFGDMGFSARDSKGQIIVNTAGSQTEDADHAVKRTVTGGDISGSLELPKWRRGESINDIFVIPEGQFSAKYTITYSYTEAADPSDPDSADKPAEPKTRDVYVIRQKGDYNGDGEVNFLDLLTDTVLADGDPVFQNYTYVEPEELETAILKKNQNSTEPLFDLLFTPPVDKPASEPDGNGSDDLSAMKYSIEFYAADADPDASPTPLDPTALPAGQEVIMAVKADNMQSMCPFGLVNAAFAISYDSRNFTLMGFDEVTGEDYSAMKVSSDAETVNARWVSSLGNFFDPQDMDITVKASDIPLDENSRRVYIHYMDSSGNTIWTENEGYLAAFKFKVKNHSFTGSPFSWLDYDLAVDDAQYNRHALLNGTTPFQKPDDVLTAATASEVVGYTITGEVVSYNAKNPVTYELYKMGDGGEYETTPSYTGTAVEGGESTTAMQQNQSLSIADISNGTYKLVLRKTAHVSFTIFNIKVEDADVDLTQDARVAVKSIVMGAGDLNGDGTITVADKNIVTNSANFGKLASTAKDSIADINGDGSITVADKNILTNANVFGKSEKNYTVE